MTAPARDFVDIKGASIDQVRTLAAALDCYCGQELERMLYGPLNVRELMRAKRMRTTLQNWLLAYESGVAGIDVACSWPPTDPRAASMPGAAGSEAALLDNTDAASRPFDKEA